MTVNDPINTVDATRTINDNGTVTYQVTTERSGATVTMVVPIDVDENTSTFLTSVIDYSFARWMLLEFEQSDLIDIAGKAGGDDAGTQSDQPDEV